MEKISWTSEGILKKTMQCIAPLPSQRDYVRDLAAIFSVHINRNELIDEGYFPDDLPTSSAIVVAPPGQGKIYLLRKMAVCMGLNVITIDCSTLEDENNKGVPLGERLARAQATAKDKKTFMRSILFLDKADKMLRRCAGNGMTAILQMFNGGTVAVTGQDGKTDFVDTRRFMVLLAGAFDGLDEIVRERICTRPPMDLGCQLDNNEYSSANLMRQVIAEDMIQFGVMPELMERVGNILVVPPLQREDYRQLLNAEEGGLRSRYSNYLRNIYGVDFEIAESGIDWITQKCMKSNAGARAVNPLVNEIMHRAVMAVEEQGSICKVILEADGDACYVTYEYGNRHYAFHDPVRNGQDNLPWCTIKAKTCAALVRKLCRFAWEMGENSEMIPELEAFLSCAIPFLHRRCRASEFDFVSLERMARTTHRSCEKSAFDVVMQGERYTDIDAYQRFDKLYSTWTQRHLISALQNTMTAIQKKNGPCRVRFNVPAGK